MEVVFKKTKQFPNGDVRVYYKNGYKSDTLIGDLKANFLRVVKRKLNRIEREFKKKDLVDRFNGLNRLDIHKHTARALRHIDLQLSEVDLDNRRRAVQRSRQELYDICCCNHFDFFVTLTFDDGKINSYDDVATRKAFSNFIFYLRQKFPQLYYVCVPEYQERGALHFHLLIGGVTMEELGCVPAINQKKGSKHYGECLFVHGKQIFNVTAWKKGHSTLSVIGNLEASRYYICKYMTKQVTDERFFNKRRYYVSQNIVKPVVTKEILPVSSKDAWNVNLATYQISYLSPFKQYGIFDKIPVKGYHVYGFTEDYKDAKPLSACIGVKRGMQETLRKSLLVSLGVIKNDCVQNSAKKRHLSPESVKHANDLVNAPKTPRTCDRVVRILGESMIADPKERERYNKMARADNVYFTMHPWLYDTPMPFDWSVDDVKPYLDEIGLL